MSPWWMLAAAAGMGYLTGSIPVGYLVGRSQGVDVRAHGSGKTGATNVLRTLGPRASAAVMLGDIAKGAVAVALAMLLRQSMEAEVAAGVAAIIGHIFPLFAGFRGGRGVSTALGAMLVISPLVGVVGLLAGGAVIACSRQASLGSLAGAAAGLLAILALFVTGAQSVLPVIYCFLAVLILVVAHRDNIQRLADGTERKIQL